MKKSVLLVLFTVVLIAGNAWADFSGQRFVIQDNSDIALWPPSDASAASHALGFDVLSIQNNGLSSHIASLLFQTDSRDLGSTWYQAGRIALLRTDNAGSSFGFGLRSGNRMNEVMRMLSSGNVGIGTTAPTCKLDVKGTIRAEEIKVETVAANAITLKNESWADYVFKDGYILKPLAEVETFINENKHLPEVPPADEIQKNGLNMADMMAIQMKKIEELTLHMIEQEKRVMTMKKENDELKSRLIALETKQSSRELNHGSVGANQ